MLAVWRFRSSATSLLKPSWWRFSGSSHQPRSRPPRRSSWLGGRFSFSSYWPKNAFGRYRSQQSFERAFDVFAPREHALQVEPQSRVPRVRAHRLEAERQQEIGRKHARGRLPAAVAERLDCLHTATGQVLRDRLQQDPAEPAAGEFRQHIGGHQQRGVGAYWTGGEGGRPG